MNQWKHKILAHGTLIITNWVYLTYLIGASCRGSLLLSAWQDAIFSVAVCMLRGVLLWQLQYISTFCCGSIHFILKWQLTPLAVAVFTFCCGSIYFLLWQLTPLAVAVSTFCCGSIHFLLWQLTPLAVAVSTFFCGSSSVLDQVVRGRCHFWGYIQAISPDNFSTEDHARANS